MKFKINYTIGNYSDSVVIEGTSVEECREKAQVEIKKRGGTNAWSEEIK